DSSVTGVQTCALPICTRTLPGNRRAAEGVRAVARCGHRPAWQHVRRRDGDSLMVAALMVFVLVAGLVLGVYAAARAIPKAAAERRLELRLHDVSPIIDDTEESVLMQEPSGPLPGIDRLLTRAPGTASLTRLITQSGIQTTPGTILLASIVAGVAAAAATTLF